jgi:hypothetical protein
MFTVMPLAHDYTPGNKLEKAMWSRARGGGAAGRIPATSLAALAREAAGDGLGVA